MSFENAKEQREMWTSTKQVRQTSCSCKIRGIVKISINDEIILFRHEAKVPANSVIAKKNVS